MAHPVIVVVVPGLPRAAVVGRADGRAVGLGLQDFSGEVDVVQVHGVAVHLHPVHGQVRQVAVLQGDVGGGDLPRVLFPQHAGVRPGLVDGGLPLRVAEAAVGHERHLREGVVAVRPAFGCRAYLILELPVALAHDLGDGEVHRAEPGEGAVAPAVVRVLRGVVGGVWTVEDAHADVAGGHRADFPVLQFQRACLVLHVHAVDDAASGSAPLVAHLHVGAIVYQ